MKDLSSCGACTTQVVNEDCEQNDDTGHDQLPFGGDTHHGQTLLQGFHEQRTNESAEDRSTTTCKRGTTDNDCCDDIQFKANAFSRLNEAETCGVEDRAKSHEDTSNHVDDDLPLTNVHTGQTRCLFIGADCKGVAAENGLAEQECCNDGSDNEEQCCIGDRQEGDQLAGREENVALVLDVDGWKPLDTR